MRSIILPIQQPVSLRRGSSQLAMVKAAMATDLHLAPYVHTQSIWELERVEESVRNDGCTLVRRFRLQESGSLDAETLDATQ